jgi:hypothetical protein
MTFDINLTEEDVNKIAARVAEIVKRDVKTTETGQDVIFGVAGLAEYLQLEVQWIYQHRNEIPHIKVSKFLRFRKSEIDTWLNKQSRKPLQACKLPK